MLKSMLSSESTLAYVAEATTSVPQRMHLYPCTENISRNRDSAKTLRTVNFRWVPLAIEMLPFEIAVVHPVLSDKWKVTCRASPLVTPHHLTNRRSKLAVQPAWLRAKQR